jgi:hypothetical protein
MIGLMIVHRPAGGAWGVPEKLSPILCNAFDITTTLDGTTWILWGDSPGLVLQSRNSDGIWNPVEILTEDIAEYLHVDIADDGRQYMVYAYLEDIYFIERADAGSSWSPPIIVGVIDGYAGNLNLISGPSGELHLAFFQNWNIFYRIRYPDGKWSIGGLMPEQDRKFPPAMIPEADGSAQAVWADTNDSFAYSVLHLPKTGFGSLEETINISTQAYQPTLSFFFNLPNALADRSFEARIGGQAVFSTSTATSGWERRWIDLSPWKGQQVTVQFLLTDGPMDTQVYVYLDEVTAGSARTPTISSVEMDADQVTVKGTNFLEGVDIWIGGVQVPVVNRVDAQTLLMTLPEDLLPGWQDIRVINPQGEEAWVKNGLFWKEVLHIPLVGKNYR